MHGKIEVSTRCYTIDIRGLHGTNHNVLIFRRINGQSKIHDFDVNAVILLGKVWTAKPKVMLTPKDA